MAKTIAKISLEDAVFWGALLVLFAWALGKATGLIRSPAWVETIPVFSIVFAAGALYQKFSALVAEVGGLTRTVEGMKTSFVKLETRCDERHKKR